MSAVNLSPAVPVPTPAPLTASQANQSGQVTTLLATAAQWQAAASDSLDKLSSGSTDPADLLLAQAHTAGLTVSVATASAFIAAQKDIKKQVIGNM